MFHDGSGMRLPVVGDERRRRRMMMMKKKKKRGSMN
jgi:hypothetical protein